MRNELKKLNNSKILTVPNVMSLFRLVLIPVYLYFYCIKEEYFSAILVVIISMITDVCDGMIARKFNMVSDLGKILDPLADKLTQAAFILSLSIRYRWMLWLIALMAVREAVVTGLGYIVLKKTGVVGGAKWYGKLATVVLEGSLLALLVFPQIPESGVIVLCAVSAGCIALSLVLYVLNYAGVLRAKREAAVRFNTLRFFEVLFIAFWIALIIAVFLNRESLTVEAIAEYSTANIFLTVIMIMALFAIKSVSIVVYIGILYAACGLMFSPPIAVAVNTLGTVVSVMIPYLLGRKVGAPLAENICEKYPKIAQIRTLREKNDTLFCIAVRMMYILPADIVSFYLGAVKYSAWKYVVISMLSLAPILALCTFMGTNLSDISSPEFILSAALMVAFMAASVVLFGRLTKKR